jgi:nucleotide-binding universal stress UspA family protein
MWDMEPRKVLVGVDSRSTEAALQYAVAEARRRGCGIHLVHVARPVLATRSLDDIALVDGELRNPDQLLLASAAGRTQKLLDDVAPDDDRLSVSTELTHGSVVAALQSMSRRAGLLVLEHHGMGPGGETPTLSVTAGLAAVAHCPMVAVPGTWRPSSGTSATVVVGVEHPDLDAAVIEAARHEADRRHARLELVQAPEGRAAAQVVLEHATGAELVVVCRHHRKHAIGAALGGTARELLRRCATPVLVVDPAVGDRVASPRRTRLAAIRGS